MSFTPWVARPIVEMPATRQRLQRLQLTFDQETGVGGGLALLVDLFTCSDLGLGETTHDFAEFCILQIVEHRYPAQ